MNRSILLFLCGFVLMFSGCSRHQEQTFGQDPHVQRILDMAGSSVDEFMEDELVYLRDKKWFNLSRVNYYYNKDEDVEYYNFVDSTSWCGTFDSITRKELQEEMLENLYLQSFSGIQQYDQNLEELRFMREDEIIQLRFGDLLQDEKIKNDLMILIREFQIKPREITVVGDTYHVNDNIITHADIEQAMSLGGIQAAKEYLKVI